MRVDYWLAEIGPHGYAADLIDGPRATDQALSRRYSSFAHLEWTTEKRSAVYELNSLQ